MKRAAWKDKLWVCLCDPRKYPNLVGGGEEYNVMARRDPKNEDSPCVKLAGPYDTEAEAQAWVDGQMSQITAMWERYDRYNRLVQMRAATPLDFAEKPQWTKEHLEATFVQPVPKMENKRLSLPFYMSARKDGRLEVYNFAGEDFISDDWKIA